MPAPGTRPSEGRGECVVNVTKRVCRENVHLAVAATQGFPVLSCDFVA